MSNTERLNLIEHYEWSITFEGSFIVIKGKDNIFSLSRQFGKLREVIDAALDMQMKWSLGK